MESTPRWSTRSASATAHDPAVVSRRGAGNGWRVLLLLVSLLGSFSAAAQCAGGSTCIAGNGPTAAVVVTGRINVSPDTPAGAVISGRIQAPGYAVEVTQNGAPNVSGALLFRVAAGNLAPGFTDVYNTNIPGIGVRYIVTLPSNPSVNPDLVGEWRITNSQLRWALRPPANGGPWALNVGRSVEFVNLTQGAKAGTITTVPQVATIATVSTSADEWGAVPLYNGSVTGGTLSTRTCTLQQVPDIALPQMPARDLPSVGSTVSPRNFSISATCSGPLVFALGFSVATGFEDMSISLLRNSVTDATGAKGYGIQIIEGGTGATINANVKQWVTTVDSTTFRQDFTARYYRFGATPTGGRIQSVLIYTLDYR